MVLRPPYAQLNWWLPVYEVEAENSMAFHPRYFDGPRQDSSPGYACELDVSCCNSPQRGSRVLVGSSMQGVGSAADRKDPPWTTEPA